MTKPKIILVGAGGHCRSCIDVIEQEGLFEILGIVDKVGENAAYTVLGYPLIGTDDDLPALRREAKHAIVTVGQIKSSEVRFRLFNQLKEADYELPSIVSPLAYVSRHAVIGRGTIVMHGAMVNTGAKVGENCILNSQCLIEHDAEVGDCVHISTGAILNGGSRVWKRSFVGSGAVVVQEVTVPKFSFVRAGRLVVSYKDIQPLEHD